VTLGQGRASRSLSRSAGGDCCCATRARLNRLWRLRAGHAPREGTPCPRDRAAGADVQVIGSGHRNDPAASQRALERFDGNRQKAAEALRISTVRLWRKMKQDGLSTWRAARYFFFGAAAAGFASMSVATMV
jgi:hypothetical protein